MGNDAGLENPASGQENYRSITKGTLPQFHVPGSWVTYGALGLWL